jgi:spoIIIJ-associated protein
MAHEQIQEQIKGLLETAGFPAESVAVSYDEVSNTYWFSVSSSDARVLLGLDAEALAAINHIATKIVEKSGRDVENHPRVIVDANDFEKKKIENLKTIAHMMAERARYFKSKIDVDPMPPHERRIVHEFLSGMPDIQTESEGTGPNRHIVIRYVESSI